VIVALIGAAVVAAGLGGLGWLRLSWLTVTVVGPSMQPALQAGDRVLVRRTSLARVRTGQVVVLDDESGTIIKRVVAAPGDPVPPSLAGNVAGPVPPGRLLLLGDNRDRSADSRQHGYYDGAHLVGVAVRPLGRGRP
jgi:signal peptidase I